MVDERILVMGDENKLGDFQECQQYLSTVVQNLAVQAKAESNMSMICKCQQACSQLESHENSMAA